MNINIDTEEICEILKEKEIENEMLLEEVKLKHIVEYNLRD